MNHIHPRGCLLVRLLVLAAFLSPAGGIAGMGGRMTRAPRSSHLARALICTVFAVCLAASGTVHGITHGSSGSNPQVVRVSVPSSGEPVNCTGVVISPGHILTAAHCVNGDYNWPLATSKLGALPGGIIDIRDAEGNLIATSHTDEVSFTALASESPMNFNNPFVSVHDLAVIPVDRRIRVSIAPWAKLPFDSTWAANECPSDFTGLFYGYSSGSLQKATAEIKRGLPSQWGDVYRAEFSTTSIFEILPVFSDFFGFGDLFDNKPVLEHGDSGGPLFFGDKLCGINSAWGPRFIPSCTWHSEICVLGICIPLLPYFSCEMGLDNRYARVDLAGIDLLLLAEPPLFDDRGLLYGTCPPGTPAPYDDVDSDLDFLPDACDPCPTRFDAAYRFDGTYTVLPESDGDGDGIADECDRCPGLKTARKEGADGNWIQPDSDADGMGDECDKCAHSNLRKGLTVYPAKFVSDLQCCAKGSDCGNKLAKCLPLEDVDVGGILLNSCPTTKHRCSLPPDKDGDEWGDQCDNCVGVINNQDDFDDDGVGDACDNCNGKHPYDLKLGSDNDDGWDPLDQNDVVCSTNQDCVTNTTEADSECEPGKLRDNGPSGFSPDLPHCSKLTDTDDDKLGDRCDNCARMPNPAQQNCNKLIEKERGLSYPYLGDACDANPCTWITTFAFNSTTFDVDDPSYADLWLTFWMHPQRLPSSVPQCPSLPVPLQCYSYPDAEPHFDTSYTGTPKATVGSRFCKCDMKKSDGTYASATVEQCKLLFGCNLDPNEYGLPDPHSHWAVPSLVKTATPPLKQASGFSDELPGLTMEVSRNVPSSFALSSLAESSKAPTAVSWNLTADGAGDLNPPNSLVKAYGLSAVYWAAVREIPEMPSASATTFRTWSNSYYANSFALEKMPGTGQAMLVCPGGNCGGGCFACKFWVDAMEMLISPEKVVIAQGLQGKVDITSAFSQGAIELLAQPNLRWTAAAEGSRSLYRGSIGLASVSIDGSKVLGGLAMVGGQIQPITRSLIDVGLASAEAASDPRGPQARSDFGVVLSATEGSVFVIGGTLGSGALAGDLWRYDFSWQAWQKLPLQGPGPRNVLAATFLPDTRSLYFVDELKVGVHQARLVRYDLSTQKISVLGAWPRTPQVDNVFLTSTDDGTLVLAGSSSTLKYVAGVVLRPSAQQVSIEAGFFQKGVLAFGPVLTEDGLTLPLASLSPSGVENTFIARNELFSQDKPKKGNGKAWGKSTPIDIKDVL